MGGEYGQSFALIIQDGTTASHLNFLCQISHEAMVALGADSHQDTQQ